MARKSEYKQARQQLGISETSIISNIGILRNEDRDLHSDVNSSNVVGRFLARILSFDYRAVSIFMHLPLAPQLFLEPSEQNGINCLDAVLVILNHCDDFTRQRLLECMAKCNLSVPILLPDLRENEQRVFQQWALASIVKTIPSNDGTFYDVVVSRHPFHVALFVKFGELNEFCMSDLLNKIIGDVQENNMPYSFFGEKVESNPPQLSHGLLEAVWFVPDNRHTSVTTCKLTVPLCFCYLHGNPDFHAKEFDFAFESSSIVVIFVPKSSVDNFIEKFNELGKERKVIIALYSPTRTAKIDNIRSKLRTRVKDFSGTNLTNIARALCTEISDVLVNATPSTFTLHNTGRYICELKNIAIDMNASCRNGFDQGQKIEMLFSRSRQHFDKIFKLLRHWNYFSRLFKDTKWKRAKTNICHEMERHRQQLRQSRIVQSQETLSDPILFFLKILEESSDIEQIYMFSWLKVFFKHRAFSKIKFSEESFFSVQQEIDQIRFDYGNEGSVNEEERSCFPRENDTIEQVTYGIDTLLQELGQLYESRTFMGIDASHISNVAANMVLNGHSIDIFDGNTGNVPIKWVEGVLKAVEGIVGDKTTFVISILGVQSAGKSTFLNALFGTNFEANAGRCTKGVSIQMLPLDSSLQHETGCDFILIIDTEGLQPLQDLHKVSNEMATLVLSLSNFVFLNIAGQTIESDIKNILQIAALAFLRMEQVNLKCNCFVVQQLVSDPTVIRKNKHDIKSLSKKIDEAVQHAAKVENIQTETSKTYLGIFRIMNYTKGFGRLQYFAPLWGGNIMSPPDTTYSDLVLELRKEMICLINNNGFECLQLSVFIQRVLDVWKAIKEDDFLFYFQNTEEIKQFNQFKEEYHKICATFSSDMVRWKLKHLRKVKPMRDNEAIDQKYCKDLYEKLSKYTDKVYYQIDMLFCKDDYWLIKPKAQYFKDDFKERVNHTYKSILHSFETSSEVLQSRVWIKTTKQMSQAVQTLATKTLRTHEDTFYSVKEEFEVFWERELLNIKAQFLEQVRDRSLQEKVLIDIENSLRDLYRDTLLEKDIRKNMFNLLTTHILQGIIDDSRLLQYAGDEEETFSNYLSYAFKFVDMSTCPTLVNNIQNCTLNFVNSARAKRVTDCSFVYKVQEVTTPFQGKISNQTLATVILKVCLWMAPLLLREFALSKWELINVSLENMRDDFYNEYVTARKFVSKQEFQTTLSFSLFIEQELVYTIHDELATTLINKFTSPIFTSKENLLHKVLLELCEKWNFKDYIMYLTNTKGFIEDWALRFVSKSCVLPKNNLQFYVSIERIAKNLIDKKLSEISDILHKRMQKPIIQYHELFVNVFRDIGRVCDVWYDQSKLETFKSSLSYLSAEEFGIEFSKIISYFKSTLINVLKVPKETADLNIVQEWFSTVPKTHKELIANLRLCFAVCPFCPVTCDETDSHDIHRSIRHIPMGLGGITFPGHSGRLVTEDCTTLVATKYNFNRCKCYPSICNHKPSYYEEHRLDHPDWYIHPQEMSEEQPIDYWKWVLKEFNSDFANYYQVNKADVPSAWDVITREDAVLSLQGNQKTYRTQVSNVLTTHSIQV